MRPELRRAQALYRRAIRPGCEPFGWMAAELGAHPGKWLRAGLFLLSAKSAGPIAEPHLRFAVAIEMVHAASLLHDDVLDQATLRRHRPACRVQWGDRQAVLFGDYLVGRAFGLLDRATPAAYVGLGRIMEMLAIGESRQDVFERADAATVGRLTEREALAICRQKTAAFFGEVCRLGRTLSGRSDAAAERLAEYGLRCGMAYQILDDLDDLVGDEAQAGKTLGTDAALGRPTLALAILLRTHPSEARRLMPTNDPRKERRYRRLAVRSGAAAKALAVAEAQLRAAQRALTARKGGGLNGLEGSFAEWIERLRAKAAGLSRSLGRAR